MGIFKAKEKWKKLNDKNCSEFAMSANWAQISAGAPWPNPGSARAYSDILNLYAIASINLYVFQA